MQRGLTLEVAQLVHRASAREPTAASCASSPARSAALRRRARRRFQQRLERAPDPSRVGAREVGRAIASFRHEEITADYHAIVYAESEVAARAAWSAFAKKWKPRCPGVVRSLAEGGDEVLTFFRFRGDSGRRSAPPT